METPPTDRSPHGAARRLHAVLASLAVGAERFDIPALALGHEKEIGSIEVGKEADLIVIDGDPSKNISDIRKIVWVFKDGVGFNSQKIFESVKGRVGIN